MKPEFTTDGIQVQTFQEIYDELVAGYKAIYGADINLAADSPDGQRVGIEAQARLDLQSFALAVYNNLNPDLASGLSLNSTIKYSGIVRQPPSRSQVDVIIVTDRPLTLPIDYTVEDDLGQTWKTLTEVVLVSGSNTVTLFADEFGAFEAGIGTVSTPVTIVIGVVSVTNLAAATVGRDEETDKELRIRRNKSLENPGYSTVGQMYASIANLPGVTDLEVYENSDNVYDAILDMVAYSVWAVIEGGSVNSIIETIAKSKTQGTAIKGTVTGQYLETLIKPNGDEYFIIHEMKFDRPDYVPLYVQMNATRRDVAVPVDTAAIEAEIAKVTFGIGVNALASSLYYNAYQAGNTFIATDMMISLDGITWTDERLLSGPQDKFTIDVLNVTVTEIIP